MCVELMFLASSVRSMFPIIISSGVEIFQSRSLSEVITNVKRFVGQEGTDWGEFIFFSVWSCLVFHLVIEEEEETQLRAKVLVLEPLGLLYISI